MELFSSTIEALRSLIDTAPDKRTWSEDSSHPWQPGGTRNIVLKEDLGLELGSPDTESVSCLLWTENPSLVTDKRITLVGPDFPECTGSCLPYGKIVLVCVQGFTEENAYDRYRELDLTRYDLDLKGFMIRAASRSMREWCRISRDAIEKGFSSRILASELMRLVRGKPYVKSIETILVTSSSSDVGRLKGIITPAIKVISAMNKMVEEMDFDCETCDYQDVCNDASQLKAMRDAIRQRTRGGEGG